MAFTTSSLISAPTAPVRITFRRDKPSINDATSFLNLLTVSSRTAKSLEVLRNQLPWITSKDLAVIVNIAGREAEDYGRVAKAISGVPNVAALEINISCPNVKAGGMAHGSRPETAAEVTRIVKANTTLPVIVKLSPNVTNIVEIAKAVEEAGADAISLINTILAMEIDIETGKPLLGNQLGGLSGPAIRPIAVRMV